ncbi:hypothetical protein, partial [Rathayibacter iranicus]|uniref:hypothetical protein n=1 Tax=Rathayibacter iranicus TaxID=59737 RepID=UPI00132CAF91
MSWFEASFFSSPAGGYGTFPFSDERESDFLVLREFRTRSVLRFSDVPGAGWFFGEDVDSCSDAFDIDRDLGPDEGIAACFEGVDGGLDAAFAFVDEGGSGEASGDGCEGGVGEAFGADGSA